MLCKNHIQIKNKINTIHTVEISLHRNSYQRV